MTGAAAALLKMATLHSTTHVEIVGVTDIDRDEWRLLDCWV